jgi:hypothetical protein
MGRSIVIVALALAAAGGSAAPAGSGALDPPEQPDGALVLGVVGHDRDVAAVTREWALIANPRTGKGRRRRLAGGTLCHGPLLAVDDHVIFSAYRGRRAVARALPLSLVGPARSLGFADTFAPSAAPGRLWLARWSRRRGRMRRWSNRPVPVSLREVDAGGRETARASALLPRFAQLHAATAGGFLATEGRWLTLRGPGRNRPELRARDAWFAVAGASSFAWCGGRCRAFWVANRAGRRRLRPPTGLRLSGPETAFSPDERWLAAGVTLHGHKRVAVVDVRTGRWTLVPDSRLGGYEVMAWSPSGRWLYFTAGARRLFGWRLGARLAVPLWVSPGGTVMSIATPQGSG